MKHMFELPWLDSNTPLFPNTCQALDEPNGLLAAGGQLTSQWLLKAYSQGIFPWFSEGEPILWWSPSPRSVIYIDQLHISKSLRKVIKRKQYTVTFDNAFEDVIQACAQPRSNQPEAGTWISEDIVQAYTQLHKEGHAHSVEVWEQDTLIGGLYGLSLGQLFFGESMFSFRTNGSKIALAHLAQQLKQWHYVAIDCQVHNSHLATLGANETPREEFEGLIRQYVCNTPDHWGNE